LAEQGLVALPASAAVHFHFGCVLEAKHQYEAAQAAFLRALDCDPNMILARFYQGAQEEALDQQEQMLNTYVQALELAEKSGMLRSGEQYLPEAHARVNHAIDVVQQAREAYLTQAMAPLVACYGRDSLQKIFRMLDVYLGKNPVEWPHPLQRPTFLLIPDIPPQPWFEREQFSFLAQIEQATDIIREELLAVLAVNNADLKPYVDMPNTAPAAPIWQELNRSTRWSGYHLFRYGERIKAHCQRCPETTAILEALPIMRVPGHAPEALFSILHPHTHIPPHTGVVNGRLTVHLPLIVPENCGAMIVGGEARPWEVGKCLIFDDSMVHEARNNSDHTRVVLIFDIWNPYLTKPEREGMTTAVDAIGRFNRKYTS